MAISCAENKPTENRESHEKPATTESDQTHKPSMKHKDKTTESAKKPSPSKSDQMREQSSLKPEHAYLEKVIIDFLTSDYLSIDSSSVAMKYFTPEFSQLWKQACQPPEGENIYWGADPILETQDMEPKLVSIGPATTEENRVQIPVTYQPLTLHFPKDAEPQTQPSGEPFVKIFVFVQTKDENWMISDIITSGIRSDKYSEVEQLKAAFASPNNTPK